MSTTAEAMLDLLRRHYMPDERRVNGIFAPEIASPDGKRRADLIWMPTTVARRDTLIGHEIKVTRADVLTELADPTKADPWSQHCTHWWLVVAHPSLVDGLDVPEVWGIMAPPSGRRTRSMTVVREAPHLRPGNPAPGYRRVASWMLHRHHEATSALDMSLKTAQGDVARLRRDLDRALLNGGGDVSPRAKRVADIVLEAERRIDDESVWAKLDQADVVQALVDLSVARATMRELQHTIRGLVRDTQRIVEPFRHQHQELTKVLAVAESVP